MPWDLRERVLDLLKSKGLFHAHVSSRLVSRDEKQNFRIGLNTDPKISRMCKNQMTRPNDIKNENASEAHFGAYVCQHQYKMQFTIELWMYNRSQKGMY